MRRTKRGVVNKRMVPDYGRQLECTWLFSWGRQREHEDTFIAITSITDVEVSA